MRRMRWIALAVAVTGVAAAAPAMGAVLPSRTTMSISGRVTDQATGSGVPGMCVEVDANLGRGDFAEVGQATTDSNGYYRTSFKQSTGTQAYYDVTARPDCGAHGWWQVVYYKGSVVLTAEPGQNAASAIDMATAAAGRIRGRIVDNRNGASLAGMQVFADDASTSPAGQGGAVTAADGSYVIGGLEPGEYKVVVYDKKFADPPQYLTVWVPQQPSPSTATQFAVAAGQDTSVNERMPHVGHITGTVTNAATGAPLKGIEVWVYQFTGNWLLSYNEGLKTRADGTYDVVGPGPGTYAVCFSDPRSIPLFASRCYANHPFDPTDQSWTSATPVSVSNFGATATGVNQKLPLAQQH